MNWPPKRPSGQSVTRNCVLPSELVAVKGGAGLSRPLLGSVLGRTGVTADVCVSNPEPTTFKLIVDPSLPSSSATVPTGKDACWMGPRLGAPSALATSLTPARI